MFQSPIANLSILPFFLLLLLLLLLFPNRHGFYRSFEPVAWEKKGDISAYPQRCFPVPTTDSFGRSETTMRMDFCHHYFYRPPNNDPFIDCTPATTTTNTNNKYFNHHSYHWEKLCLDLESKEPWSTPPLFQVQRWSLDVDPAQNRPAPAGFGIRTMCVCGHSIYLLYKHRQYLLTVPSAALDLLPRLYGRL
jgi:hypothetical protein